jgi:hypothetical protein
VRPAAQSPALGPWKATIRGWLEADIKDQVPKKQRHTARRVWQRLVAEYGAEVAESTVREFVREVKLELAAAQWAEKSDNEFHKDLARRLAETGGAGWRVRELLPYFRINICWNIIGRHFNYHFFISLAISFIRNNNSCF